MKHTNSVGKASCVAQSWLSSWGANVEFAGDGTHDLIVEQRRIGFAETASDASTLSIKNLCSPTVSVVLSELHKLTIALGMGTPKSERPEISNVIRAKTEDYEAVSMRLTQFARTANPPEHILKRFMPIIKREADRATRRHRSIFAQMQFSKEDVFQVAQVLAVNHYHQYMTQKWDHDTNCKFLVHYLQQQLERLALVTAQKARNVTFSAAGVPVEECMGVPVANAEVSVVNGEAVYETVDAEEVSEVKSNATARRKAARASLEASLKAMSHPKLVETLAEVAGNEYCDYYARKLAKELLKEHSASCVECAQ